MFVQDASRLRGCVSNPSILETVGIGFLLGIYDFSKLNCSYSFSLRCVSAASYSLGKCVYFK
jgi:hypothetical protein